MGAAPAYKEREGEKEKKKGGGGLKRSIDHVDATSQGGSQCRVDAWRWDWKWCNNAFGGFRSHHYEPWAGGLVTEAHMGRAF